MLERHYGHYGRYITKDGPDMIGRLEDTLRL